MAKANELVKTEERPIARETVTDQLLQMAVDKNLDIDKLQKLIDMKHDEEERVYRRDFDMHFALMQKDYVPAKKTAQAKDKEKLLYKYCPIENILKVYAPIISRHGFSFRFSSESIPEKMLKTTCVISGWGHVERNSVVLPILGATSFSNAIQQYGSTTSYGERYAFKAGFGVIIEGEDDDAKTNPEPKAKQEPAVEKKEPPKVVDPDSVQGKFDAIVSDIKGFLHSRVHMEELKWTVDQLKAFAYWKDVGVEAKKTFDSAPVQLILLKLQTYDKLRQIDKDNALLALVVEAADADALRDIAELAEHEAKESGEQLEIF